MLELKKAQRSKAYLKLGLSAPSGGGKTLGALLIAYGLMQEKHPNLSDEELWEKIAIIDTENGSGQLYVGAEHQNTKIGVYNALTLTAPFEVQKYIQALDLCVKHGIEVGIIDSTTHAWSGEGGLLEQQQNVTKRVGNSYVAWREITPLHNDFVEKMLQVPLHIIATMRAKQEYVQDKNDSGKTTIRKVGLEPEQRKGMEYEFTAFFEVDVDHKAYGSKDRTSIYDQKYFTINPEVGKTFMRWLESGVDTKAEVIGVTEASPMEAKENLLDDVIGLLKELGGSANEEVHAIVTKHHSSGNPNAIKDVEKLKKLHDELVDYKQIQTVTK